MEAATIRIGDKLVGAGQPVYFIAEIGINHNGNPRLARQLIDLAAESGADAVKFQKRVLTEQFSAETIENLESSDKELQFLIPFLQQAELSDADLGRLAEYTRERGLEFLCTPWDRPSVDFLMDLDVAALKLASADLTNDFLVEYLARTGLPLLVSTGMSSWPEIEHAVGLLQAAGAQFALFHCQSAYPAAFQNVNLRGMDQLRQFGVPVGYSGHERGIAISTAAVGMGASLIERHITMDRTLPGLDHAASLEPAGLLKQVRDIRALEQALGGGGRSLSRGEFLNRHSLRKSLAAARDLRAGEALTRDMLQALGPGSGVSPQRYRELLGRPLPRDVKQGEQFRESDFTDLTPTRVTRDFPRPWGCVVRYRDCERIAEWQPDLLEFHLTDYDLDHPQIPTRRFPGRMSLHVPEYYHGQLLDLCGEDADQRADSLEVVRRSLETARNLHDACFPEQQDPVLIVLHPGGMSYEERVPDPQVLLDNLHASLDQLAGETGVEVLLENMPPFPWYFGGQWHHNIFVDAEEVAAFAAARDLHLCFDLSHAQLQCNLVGQDLLDYLRIIRPHIRHLHLADSSGTDAEALQFGEGMTDLVGVMRELQDVEAMVIPEIWMGHLYGGEGSLVALLRIKEAIEKIGG
ncbi:MAG TPA: N-acetylneuraminate synthase family protein [Armatimonadota bacterium]|jgi:N-acetylneuraminate synthase